MALLWGIAAASSAQAWDNHRPIVELSLARPEGISSPLDRTLNPPLAGDLEKQFTSLGRELTLNLSKLSAGTARAPTTAVKSDEWLARYVDEPDAGMDTELGPEADANGDRPYTGGAQGPTSAGFRHLFFPGWRLSQPIDTLQFPTRPLGQARARMILMGETARRLFSEGSPAAGLRVLAWSLHYLQDLGQPYHVAQVPNIHMVPWHTALVWPPKAGYQRLLSETTRVLANYHWAYEGYVREQLRRGKDSPLTDCLSSPEQHSKPLPVDLQAPDFLRTLASAVVDESRTLAPKVGEASVRMFLGLKAQNVDLPNGKGELDFQDLIIRPDYVEKRQALHQPTCEALATSARASRLLVEWALQAK